MSNVWIFPQVSSLVPRRPGLLAAHHWMILFVTAPALLVGWNPTGWTCGVLWRETMAEWQFLPGERVEEGEIQCGLKQEEITMQTYRVILLHRERRFYLIS